jgi:AcrR family transcriptional regulator
MEYKQPEAAGEQPTPRHLRSAGQQMRSQLLDSAVPLFRARGLAAVSVSEIAKAAGAFPNQITYYFGSKDAMFVEAACREMLHVAQQAERRAGRARSLKGYKDALIQEVMGGDTLAFFIEALALGQRQPSLAPQIARTVDRLHREGARAFEQAMTSRRWRTIDSAATVAQRFWALVIGVALRSAAMGASTTDSINEVRALLNLGVVARSAPSNPLQLIKKA